MTGPMKHKGMPGRGRQDRRIREMDHDPYHSKLKLSGPAVCSQCGVVFADGRWQWGEPGHEYREVVCPACQRVRDRVPAGFLTLKGAFLGRHRDEIENLVRNVEEREKAHHPMKRIMGFDEQDGALVVTFTEPRLARGAGEAVEDAFEGELAIQYSEDEFLLRVYWTREA
ncbi:MAG: ATPase [Gammaproteobacteria bacterium]|nr:ATPase [Gammaproteobacteria bacterium]NIR99084.1 ATPase [Gammaproteobacteria bacterium]NIT64716.1 ATPase [Gammaproteobacteria bacterium]NIV21674.1 ATPase [Gammaproteobacteria bacterium]NIX10636.1 ATPase [Gammaproteobacteria bacterium]